LEHTGLERQVARFQARSAFTGAGFTTNESESVVEHPVRRRVVMWLMLIGNAGFVSATATLFLSLSGLGEGMETWISVSALAGGLILLCLLETNAWLDRLMCSGMRHVAGLTHPSGVSLIQLSGGFEVAEMHVEKGGRLVGKTLEELGQAQNTAVVLGIHFRGGAYLGMPPPDTIVGAEDRLVLYGCEAQLNEFGRQQPH